MAVDEHARTDPAATAVSVSALLRDRAETQPDRLGYRFLVDGERAEEVLTYGAAHARAAAIAAALREAGATPGSRVLLVLPPGLDYVASIFGCMYAHVVAVPVYPPDPFRLERSLGRVTAVVRDAAPVVALTIAPLLGYLDELAGQAPELAGLRWLAVDTAPAEGSGLDALAPAGPQDTALLQYTSGSTSQPRGVVLSHRNLLHNSDLIQRVFGTTPDSHGLVWLPPYHDMGLIGGIVQPLYAGCPVTLMSPLSFLEKPLRWLRAIDRFGATVSGGPNFAFDLCVRRAREEGLDPVADLDLRSWQVAFTGAEPVRPATLDRFVDAFRPSGFRASSLLPCYGLAEATLLVTGSRGATVVDVDGPALSRDEVRAGTGDTARSLVACGVGGVDQSVVLVDPATAEPCGAGRVGEVWVSGPSVSGGYWRNPDATARVFGARTADGAGPYLRTGDLGFLHEGRLVIAGRHKDVIVVRGRNHYPQDLEETAETAHPALRPGCSAAFTSAPGGAEALLTVVLEVRRHAGDVPAAEVAARVRDAVAAHHGVQVRDVVLIAAGGMPKTSSGKVQRWLCRERLDAAELPVLGHDAPAPGGPAVVEGVTPTQIRRAPAADRGRLVATYLRERVAELTGCAPGEVDPTRPPTGSGLDSLGVMHLQHRVESDLGVRPPIAELLGGADLAAVAATIEAALASAPTGAGPVRTGGDVRTGSHAVGDHVLPLSRGQRWTWVVSRLQPDTTGYQLSCALRLPAGTDAAALRRAVDAVVARHPALRTTFPLQDGRPVQRVHAALPVALRIRDARDSTGPALLRRLSRSAARPFDLAAGPLLRLELHRRDDGDVLLVVVHHIVVDFLSLVVLVRELGELYTAYAAGAEPGPAPVRASYPDVVLAQEELLADPARAAAHERYWDAQIGAGVPRLDLRATAGAGVRRLALPAELGRQLRDAAAAEGVTLYVLALAAFQAVLHRATGQADIAVGASTSGRDRADFAEVVGCCTNPVLLRSTVRSGEPFRDLLRRTRDQVVGALEHQAYPAALLAERHRAELGGRPLFDVMFTFNRGPGPAADLAGAAMMGVGGRFALGGLDVQVVPLSPGEPAVPLELVVAEVAGELHATLRYGPGVLDDVGADRLVADLLATLAALARDPAAPAA